MRKILREAGLPVRADDDDDAGAGQGGAQEHGEGPWQGGGEFEEIRAVEMQDDGQAEQAAEGAEQRFAGRAAARGHVEMRADGAAGQALPEQGGRRPFKKWRAGGRARRRHRVNPGPGVGMAFGSAAQWSRR